MNPTFQRAANPGTILVEALAFTENLREINPLVGKANADTVVVAGKNYAPGTLEYLNFYAAVSLMDGFGSDGKANKVIAFRGNLEFRLVKEPKPDQFRADFFPLLFSIQQAGA